MHHQLRGLVTFLIGLLLVSATGCSVFTSTSKTLEVTGESIVGLATQFDAVSRHMTAACNAKTYTVQTCTSYRLFGEKFKQGYPAAKSLWNAGTQFEDKGLVEGAKNALVKLSGDLAPYLAMMGGK